MPEPASTRLALIGPTGGTDPIADGDDAIRAIIAQLEAVGAGFQQGTSRPAASGALEGFFYVHTGTGVLSYCTGSVWLDYLSATKLPGYEIGYDAITADVTVSGASIGAATPIISCAAHTFDGGPVYMEFSAPSFDGSGGVLDIHLMEGATDLGILISSPNDNDPAYSKFRLTPSAGSHTYTIAGVRGGFNWTVKAGPGGAAQLVPAFARFTKA